jgi:hypothetical protein
MYLIYIDESGTPVKYNKDPKHFSLTGCITNEKDWNLINEAIIVLKRKYFRRYDPYTIELHAKNIFHKSGFFIRELRGNRNFDLLDEFYDIVSTLPVVVITVVIDKKALEHKQSVSSFIVNFTSYQLCWHYLIERLCKFLNKKNFEFDNSGEGNQFGLLLIDNQSNKKLNQRVRNTILNYLRGKKYIKIGRKHIATKYLIKEIHFLESEFYNLSQITDLIAYTVNRKHSSKNKRSKIDQYNEKYYNKIEKLFDTDVNGKKEGCGIKIYP